jgi:20S proteasome alpha/beta subunit
MSDDLSTINIGDGDGKLYSTSSFVFSGSGSDLVMHFIMRTEKKFSPSDTLEECIELIWQCYRVASADLYVTGFPSIAVVGEKGIRDFSKRCSAIWNRIESNYFTDLKLMIKESDHL